MIEYFINGIAFAAGVSAWLTAPILLVLLSLKPWLWP